MKSIIGFIILVVSANAFALPNVWECHETPDYKLRLKSNQWASGVVGRSAYKLTLNGPNSRLEYESANSTMELACTDHPVPSGKFLCLSINIGFVLSLDLDTGRAVFMQVPADATGRKDVIMEEYQCVEI